MSAAGRGGGRVAGVLVAAGRGERLGPGGAKAFVALDGVPLLVHAARALTASGAVDDVVVVVAPGDEGRARDVLAAAAVPVRHVCAGGATRQASVACGLAHVGADAAAVAVHDAARPLASPALVARVVAALAPPLAAVAPGLPVVDTIKLVAPGGNRVLRTLDRRDLRAVQTPQVFDRVTLQQAHERPDVDATDDLALVEAVGGRVALVEGERRNFKITYPEDLALAAALLAEARG